MNHIQYCFLSYASSRILDLVYAAWVEQRQKRSGSLGKCSPSLSLDEAFLFRELESPYLCTMLTVEGEHSKAKSKHTSKFTWKEVHSMFTKK